MLSCLIESKLEPSAWIAQLQRNMLWIIEFSVICSFKTISGLGMRLFCIRENIMLVISKMNWSVNSIVRIPESPFAFSGYIFKPIAFVRVPELRTQVFPCVASRLVPTDCSRQPLFGQFTLLNRNVLTTKTWLRSSLWSFLQINI